ncbi:MAG: 2-oxoacid:acceptor oxidoreductase subunit alpha [Bacteroidota bacterium]|nr:2-oxoacid:acceptor oxidoreductase subunit alpha [Bacteroidota bacterium]MDP4241138.1 2-oxoacid:acceptor oxidoreductase subunit alpha [Bacteroidota bacterium]MDP4286530.1 2-oxoacid:acceptor oxidoreductase subunit alpha [Bacteroidota bacterium]
MPGINDFAIKLANVNGTGSASANGLLMQTMFRMGIPVAGKNLFPSNIQGLPTWYEIRVSAKGYGARALDYDLMVAMNGQTYAKDVAEVRSGGYLLYDSSWPLPNELYRDDVTFLGVPLSEMLTKTVPEPRARILMKNIMYSGSLAALLGLDMEIIGELIKESFGKKQALLDANKKALQAGYEFAQKQFACPLPFHCEKMDGNKNKILIDGNTASALGAIYAGATVAAWYPITPSTSVMDAFKSFADRYRVDPETKKNNYVFLQAEDELAAIGMVIGASWAGARSFTATSGPGISLMNELIGFAYYAEIPAVIMDVQRTGPSTGMPTRTQQSDILLCAYASHGDTKHILLFPANPTECFEFAVKSFDLAEQFQTPVFMLSDLDIGMNDWVTDRFTWDDNYKPNRGKVLTTEEIDQLTSFYRYSPVDENFVAARTLPGVNSKGAFFTRGSGHNRLGGYTETPSEYQEVMDRLLSKHHAAAKSVPEAVFVKNKLHFVDGTGHCASIGIISVGGCDAACREAIDILEQDGVAADYMRIRGFPFGREVEQFLRRHDVCYVVEQNRDGQLRSLLILETKTPKEKLLSIREYGGFPLSARTVIEAIQHKEGKHVVPELSGGILMEE